MKASFLTNPEIIASGTYWVCETLDLNAPITEQGTAYLLSDGETLYIKQGGQKPPYKWASEQEKHIFANSKGFYFLGDSVEIYKGKLKGQVKVIKSQFRYVVPNTYGKAFVNYLVFDDGTKTKMSNCKINGVKVLAPFNGFYVGGRL